MINVIIIHGILISRDCSMKSRIGVVYGNKQRVAELAYDALRQMWIYQTRPTSQPSRVEGYVIQVMHLTMIYVCLEVYVIYYHAIKIHYKGLCRLIVIEQTECTCKGHILNVG